MSAETWPCMVCGQPIRRSTDPALGSAYYEHVEDAVAQAMRRTGIHDAVRGNGRDLEQEFAHAALQLAMYHNRLDVAEYGTAWWRDLDVAGRAQYLREAKRTIGAMGLLGWAPLHPHATLYLTDERDTLKMLRETLCRAQTAIEHLRDDRWEMDTDSPDLERIGRLIAEIDRQRPLGPDGKHGDLHTPTCGCEDR